MLQPMLEGEIQPHLLYSLATFLLFSCDCPLLRLCFLQFFLLPSILCIASNSLAALCMLHHESMNDDKLLHTSHFFNPSQWTVCAGLSSALADTSPKVASQACYAIHRWVVSISALPCTVLYCTVLYCTNGAAVIISASLLLSSTSLNDYLWIKHCIL